VISVPSAEKSTVTVMILLKKIEILQAENQITLKTGYFISATEGLSESSLLFSLL
jgi:hypothetical protein